MTPFISAITNSTNSSGLFIFFAMPDTLIRSWQRAIFSVLAVYAQPLAGEIVRLPLVRFCQIDDNAGIIKTITLYYGGGEIIKHVAVYSIKTASRAVNAVKRVIAGQAKAGSFYFESRWHILSSFMILFELSIRLNLFGDMPDPAVEPISQKTNI
ncbi:MAG: hypothetical protein JSV44_09695 [Candidatus Zixiibacteriota bacterium]|nr:MAG: hypothetical protein JSV44_09695 [candidate division Zixibacteria bacterium]